MTAARSEEAGPFQFSMQIQIDTAKYQASKKPAVGCFVIPDASIASPGVVGECSCLKCGCRDEGPQSLGPVECNLFPGRLTARAADPPRGVGYLVKGTNRYKIPAFIEVDTCGCGAVARMGLAIVIKEVA